MVAVIGCSLDGVGKLRGGPKNPAAGNLRQFIGSAVSLISTSSIGFSTDAPASSQVWNA